MNQVMLTSGIYQLVMAVMAIIIVWFLLRLLDVSLGFRFRTWLQENNNDTAVGIYLGLRFLGACILVGLLFS